MKFEYDYLVVEAGIFGSVFAYEAKKRGKKVLVIDKRDHIGGNMYTKNMDGIHVHYYGAIFSIHQIKKFGITLINLLNLIITLTHQLLTIRKTI